MNIFKIKNIYPCYFHLFYPKIVIIHYINVLFNSFFFPHAFYSSMHVSKIYIHVVILALFVKAKPCLIIELKPSKCMGSLGIQEKET